MHQYNLAEREDRSIVQLLADLSRELQEILRKEVELVRLEISSGLASMSTAMASLAIGAVIVQAGFLVILAAGVLALDRLLQEPWLSALVVGTLTIVVGVALLLQARSRLDTEKLQPKRSQKSLQKDKQVITEHL